MGDWDRLAALSWADRRLLVRAGALLVQARFTLASTALRPDPRARPREATVTASPPQLARAHALARLVAVAAARIPLRVACLHRSVVLWRLLRREGIPCALRLGARAGNGPFEAHAWVECGGVALAEDDAHLATFAPFTDAVAPAGEAECRGAHALKPRAPRRVRTASRRS
ncbi:MAG: lasso peptide biosynthesis B2 protein [Burkholderiales bacterium]|nr:lasso peptide biosynthesis B2 protein [Burkholderiales bacterium]